MDEFNFLFNKLFGKNYTYKKRRFSPKLKYFLRELYLSLEEKPKKILKVKKATEKIIKFLNSKEGNTDGNCWAVNIFICLVIQEYIVYSDLPFELQSILDDMAMGLHDAHTAPDIAKMCECLPSQLLERIEKIKVDKFAL